MTPCCFRRHTLEVKRDKDVAKLHIVRIIALLQSHEEQGYRRNEHTKSRAHGRSNTSQIYVPEEGASS